MLLLLLLLLATPLRALVEVGGGEIFIDLDARAGIQSNIFANNREVADIVYSVTPGVSFERARGRVLMAALASTSIIRFDSHEEQDSEDYSVAVQFILPREELIPYSGSLGLTYFLASTPNEDIGERLLSESTGLTTKFEYDIIGKTAIGVGIALNRTDYKKSDVNDTEEAKLTLNAIYRYSPKLNLSCGDEITWYGVNGEDTPDGVSHAFYLGADGELSPKITAQLRGGFQLRTYKSALWDDEYDLFFSASTAWSPTAQLSLGLTADRKFSVTASKLSKFTTSIAANASYQLNEELSFGAAVGASSADFTTASNSQGNRRDNQYYLELSYSWKPPFLREYKVTRGLDFSGTLRLAEKVSTSDFFTYTEPSYDMGVSYRF